MGAIGSENRPGLVTLYLLICSQRAHYTQLDSFGHAECPPHGDNTAPMPKDCFWRPVVCVSSMTATQSHCLDSSLTHLQLHLELCFHFGPNESHPSIYRNDLGSVFVEIERSNFSRCCFDFLRSSSLTETHQTSLFTCLQYVKANAVTTWGCSFLTLFASVQKNALSLRPHHSHHSIFAMTV